MVDIRKAIKSTNGKIFSVEFIKKDGSRRVMLCRTGVKKYLKGVGKPTNQELQVVFDMHKLQYRSFRYESVVKFNNLEVKSI
jgi:hypothetical protein